MSGPIRQILVNGRPTSGRMDDTHVWGAGELLTGDATPAERGHVSACDYCQGNPTAGPRGERCPICGALFGDMLPADEGGTP